MDANTHKRLFWFLTALVILPWLAVQARQSINDDIAVLTEFALRFLNGGHIYRDIYDTNPPLSFLIQIPPALLFKAGLPVYVATFLYPLFLLALSTLATAAILKRWNLFDDKSLRVILSAYLIAGTVLASQYFGERDQILFLGLFPFLLIQVALTFDLPISPRLKWPVLIAGAILILLKPHYGLLPALVLAHRAIHKRRLIRIACDADFIALAAATLGYAALLYLAFSDFLTQILPDAVRLYVSRRQPWVTPLAFVLGFMTAVTGLIAFAFPIPKAHRNFIAGLMGAAIISLIPYAVQGKGFYYHALPWLGFYFTGLVFLCYSLAQNRAGPLPALALVTLIAYVVMPPNIAYPTHTQYRNFELTKRIETCTGCSFFIYNDMLEMIPQTEVYSGHPFASRFPSYWFMPALLGPGGDKYKPKYAALVGEDFERLHPDIVFIGQFGDFDFPGFFSSDPAFARAWRHYAPAGSLSINRRYYFTGTIAGDHNDWVTYRIYHRH